MHGGEAVNVFAYVDYREYLKAFYGAQKERGARFSHRAFSRRAGLRSSNYLHLVMNGKRELSSEMAPNFARACSLGRVESDYFCELVSFGRAATIDEKNRCYARMVRFRGFRAAHKLDAAQAAYHSSWYVPVIRELVARRDFSGGSEMDRGAAAAADLARAGGAGARAARRARVARARAERAARAGGRGGDDRQRAARAPCRELPPHHARARDSGARRAFARGERHLDAHALCRGVGGRGPQGASARVSARAPRARRG